jgi:ribosomal protein S27E
MNDKNAVWKRYTEDKICLKCGSTIFLVNSDRTKIKCYDCKNEEKI